MAFKLIPPSLRPTGSRFAASSGSVQRMISTSIISSGKQGSGHQVRGEPAPGSSHSGVGESFHKGPDGTITNVALSLLLNAAL